MSITTRRPNSSTPNPSTTRGKAPPRPELSLLAIWLGSVIDGLADRIFGRAAWAEVLGVTPQAISQWLTGIGTPSPQNLDELVTVLEADWADVAAVELGQFAELAARPIEEVAPRTKHTAQTLDHYRTAAHREQFDLALAPLPPPLQRQVLRDATATSHELVLTPRTHKVGSTSRTVRLPSVAPAPIVVRYGAEEVVRVQRRRSLFATTEF